jgi:hypothetical protein
MSDKMASFLQFSIHYPSKWSTAFWTIWLYFNANTHQTRSSVQRNRWWDETISFQWNQSFAEEGWLLRIIDSFSLTENCFLYSFQQHFLYFVCYFWNCSLFVWKKIYKCNKQYDNSRYIQNKCIKSMVKFIKERKRSLLFNKIA